MKLENTTITLGNIYEPNDDNFLKNVLSHLLSFECEDIRDRSFFMRERGGWWDLGGPLEKNWLERGGQPKNNEGKGGSDEKTRLKIG